MKFLPVEHRRINLSLTIDDLMQSKINTTTRCSTPDDLLTALQQVTIHASNGINHVPNVFAISLLGHILAALYEMSYDELLHDHIVIPLELKQTCLDVATSSQAYYPATGVRSSIADLQTMMTSTVDLPISKAIRKALTNWHPQFTGAEQMIMTTHPNDSNKLLILASQQPLQKAFYKSLIEQMQFFPSVQLRESSINYEDIVQSCLVQLLGLSDHTMTSNFSSHTSFEQLGIDSLRAITFAEHLSQKLGIELPIDVIFQYPNVKSLASRLKQIGSNSHSSSEVLREYILHEKAGMPRVFEATNNQCSLSVLLSFVDSHKVELLQKLHECGALLFRGFEIKTAEEFSKVVELLADKDKTFLDYRDGISPRTRLTDKIFTSTDYPKQFNMALHNEMSYSYTIPSMIFFFCQVAPNEKDGGETPIGDSTAIYNAIDPNIRREFSEKKLVYVTNLPSKTNSISLGKSWQETYQTDSKAEVEAFLKDKQIQFKWLPNDRLRTLRRGDAIRQHPITGATVWCNHAHLFHPTDLDESTRQALQKRLDPLDMPKNCFFGNGDPIPDASLTHIRQVLKQHEVKWPWHKGDILVLDNVRTAHGRASFDGQRRILVAMC
jgi:alpha-ketoglutarate-dependent taurine dioxygenase/acyl carrier protein